MGESDKEQWRTCSRIGAEKKERGERKAIEVCLDETEAKTKTKQLKCQSKY